MKQNINALSPTAGVGLADQFNNFVKNGVYGSMASSTSQ